MIYGNITKKEALKIIKANYNIKSIKIVTDNVTNRQLSFNNDNKTFEFKRLNEFLSVCSKINNKKEYIKQWKMFLNEFMLESSLFYMEVF